MTIRIKTWQECLETINYMLAQKEYKFAEKTLNGIANNISHNEIMTEKQRQAVENILRSVK
jgi:hypothetical protein